MCCSPNADCPANDIAGTINNHGLQGVVILKHTLPDGRIFYSLYAHLGNINATPAVGQSVTAGQLLGTTNENNHVHFEIKARSDYVAKSGTLSFSPGQTTKNITIAVKGDTVPEPNEAFFVNLSNAINANIADNQGVGTIIDND